MKKEFPLKESNRRGAKSREAIPKTILDQLNHGEIETANLVEWLAIDQQVLVQRVLQQFDRTKYMDAIKKHLVKVKKHTVIPISKAIGTALFEQIRKNTDEVFFNQLATHSSDTVRCWVAFGIGSDALTPIHQKLQNLHSFAADAHFGVREVSWLAVRDQIASNLMESLEELTRWSYHHNANIRRFASEATRPRGVWCKHIDLLKHHPELGIPILEPLKADPSKYVQDSVANWLNDASKTQPEFVEHLCKRWELESDTSATQYILKRALRTIKKKATPRNHLK